MLRIRIFGEVPVDSIAWMERLEQAQTAASEQGRLRLTYIFSPG